MNCVVAVSAATAQSAAAVLGSLTLHDLFRWAVGIVLAGSFLIQIAPIRINPWSWLARQIGKALNKELSEIVRRGNQKMDKIEEDVAGLKFIVDEQNAKDARSKILHFGDALIFYPDREYSKDRYDEIMVNITEYSRYCDEHPDFKNHMTEATMKLIVERYEQCMRDGSFRTIGG